MCFLVSFMLTIGFIPPIVEDAQDRKDQLFASWQAAQRDVKSLVVEFTLEENDRTLNIVRKSKGTLRLLRTPKGELFASYDLFDEKVVAGVQKKRFSGLLHNGLIYMLNEEEKSACQLIYTKGDLLAFLDEYLNPCLTLLDRKKAEAKWKMEVAKQTKDYTFLNLQDKQVKRSFWNADSIEGQVALTREASEDIPKNMPRQIWCQTQNSSITYSITKWSLNATDAPKEDEFKKPENRAGWKVNNPLMLP